ncbi:hypothetical protein D3C81_1721280 [compost metagenome]
MDVERQRAPGLAAVAQGMQQVEGAHPVVELHRGGVGRIAWAWGVVAADQVRVPANVVEHAGVPSSAVSAGESMGRLPAPS